MHFRNRLFNSGYCDSFRFSWRNSFFPREFDCFDPFLYAGSFGTYFWSDSWMPPGDSGALIDSPDLADNAMSASQEEPRSFASSLANVEEPIALLQLLDGSMYGLSRYWVEGTNLHYVTDYGGENKIPLERIDFARTAELNAERGLQFDLTKKSTHP